MMKPLNPVKWLILLSFLVIAVAILSLSVGSLFISLEEILKYFIQGTDEGNAFILQNYRIPRTILSILIGSGLAVSGAIFQGILRNPLASPDVIGITKGAGLAAAIVIILFPKSPTIMLPIAALIGAALMALFIYIFSLRSGARPAVITLVGVALGAICNAAIQYLMVKEPIGINVALVWLSGSLWGKGTSHVIMLLPFILVFLPIAFVISGKLDILALGDDIANGLGENVKILRILLLALAVILAGSSVAIAGTIGFVGLLAPHMARRVVGSKHKYLMPASALFGSLLILISDIIGKGAFVPVEIPTGIVISVIGAPYFLYLLIKKK